MQYDMVFEGGGAKGMVFVGALQELEARGHTPERLLGASAGAIMATFLAAGYSAQEMGEALSEKQDGQPVFMGFLEKPPPPTKAEVEHSEIRKLLREVNLKFVPDFLEDGLDDAIASVLAGSSLSGRLFSFIDRGGFYAANNFLDWLRTKLDSGAYNLERGSFGKGKPRNFSEMNLEEFHQATGVELSLVGSDTSEASILILNHHTAPQVPVPWAVRMSMSFPLLWQEVVWQAEWGLYRGEDISGHTVVDGGMLSNFPIELFISDQPQVTDVMGEKPGPTSSVLGFLIDETREVPGAPVDKPAEGGFAISQLETIQRVQKLINTMTQAHDKIVIDAFERLVVRLPAKGYGTIEFGMSDQRREALVAAGRSTTASYFDRLESQAGDISFGVGPAERPDPQEAANQVAARILAR